jgi:hypothetical protein
MSEQTNAGAGEVVLSVISLVIIVGCAVACALCLVELICNPSLVP